MASQPFVTQLPVRYRDLDSFGHVNTAVHASYIEEARIAYFEAVVGVDLASVGTVVASLSIDYRRPIEFGDDLAVETRVSEIGTTSLTLDHELRVDGAVASTATVVVVRYDYESEEPIAVPEAWRSAIADFEGEMID